MELKESGVLTQQEFDWQKKRLLNGGKSGPSKLMQFTAGLVAFMIIGSFVYKGVEKLAETAAEDGLLCDSPEVRETAVNVLNQQIAEAKNQLGIRRAIHREHKSTESAARRSCIATRKADSLPVLQWRETKKAKAGWLTPFLGKTGQLENSGSNWRTRTSWLSSTVGLSSKNPHPLRMSHQP